MKPQEATDVSGCTAAQPAPPSVTAKSSPPTKTALSSSAVGVSRHRKAPLYSFSAASLRNPHRFCARLKLAVSRAGAERGEEEEEEKVVVAEEPAEPLPTPSQHRWYWRCASLPASTSPASVGAEGREGDGASGGLLHRQPPTHDSASREMGRPPSAEGEAMMEVLRGVQQQLRSLQESLARLQAEQHHSTTATAPPPPASSVLAFSPSSSAAHTGGGGGDGGAASVEVSEVPTPHPCDSTAVAAASATGSVPHTPDDDGTAVDRTPRPPTEMKGKRGGSTPSSDTPLSPDPVVPTPVALPVPVSVLPPAAAAAAAGWGEAANTAPLSPSALCSASSPSSALAASAGGRQEAGGSVVASTTTPILRAVYTALGAMAETSNPASRCSSASATPQLAYQCRPPQQQQHQLGHLSRRKSWVEAVEAAGRHIFVEGDGGRPVTSLKHRVVMVSSPAQTPLQTHPLGERETPEMREREEEEGEEEGTVALVSTSRGAAAHEAAPARSPVYGMLDVYLWHHHRQPLTDPHTGGRIGSAASAGAEADASLLMASATSALRRSLATTVTVYAVPGEDRGVALTSPPSTVPVDGRAVEEAAALTAGERRTEERGGEGSGVLAASSIASGGEGAEGKKVASASVGKDDAADATAAGAAAEVIEEHQQEMQAGEAAAVPAATTAAPSSSFSFVATTEAETPPPEQETVTRTECFPPLVLSAAQPVDRHGGAGGSRSDTEAEETAAPSLTGDEDHVRAADGWGAERPSTAYAGSRTRAARLPHPPPRAQAAEQATNAAFCPLGSDSSNRRSSNADTAVTAEVVELARAALQDALRHGSMPSLTVDAPVFAPAEATRPRRPRRRVSCDPVEVPEVQSSSVTVETDGDDDDTAAAATCAGGGVREGPEDSLGTGGQQDSPEPLNEEPSPLLLQEVAAYHVLASAAAAEATQVVGAATQSAAPRPASAATATAAADGPLPLPTIASCAVRRGEVREETPAESGGRVAAPLLSCNRGSVSGNAARSTYSDTAELSAPAGLSTTKRGSEHVSKTEGEASRAARLGDGKEKAHQGDGGDGVGSEGQVLSPPPLPPPHLHGLRAASHGAVDDSSGHRRSLDISWSVASMSSNGFKMPRPGAPSPAATPHCYSSAASSPQRRPSQAAPSPLRSVVGAGASRSASITTSATDMERAAARHSSAAPAAPLRQHPLLHAAASATPTSSPPSPLPVESKVTDAARPTTAAGSTVLPALFQGRPVAAGAVADGCSARGCSTVPTVAADSSSYTAKDVQRFRYGGPAAASMPPVRSGGTSVLTTGQYRVEAGTRRDGERGGSAGVKVGAAVPARDGFRQRPHSAFGAVPGLLRSPRGSQNRST